MVHASRRSVLGSMLGGLGLGALAPILERREARADTSTPRKRLLVWFTSCGTVESAFRPSGGEHDFVLGEILAPLERHRDKLLVFGPQAYDPNDIRAEVGISIKADEAGPAGGHLCQRTLTGRLPELYEGNLLASGASVDQHVAQQLGQEDFLPSLELGVRVHHVADSYLSYAGPGQPISMENSPHAAFDRVFAGLAAPDPIAERRTARRRAVLDFANGEIARVRRFAGTDDRLRLDAHQAIVSDLRARLEQTHMCTPPALASEDPADWTESWDQFEHVQEVAEAQTEIMAAALGCGITHVGTMMLGYAAANVGHPHLGVDAWLHAVSHDHALTDQLVSVHRWYNELLATLLDRLAEMPEADGSTALDHTLVLAVNEMSEGFFHTQQNMPFFLAGGAGGSLRTGRYLKFADRSHNDLLLNVCHAMGLDDETFGDPDYCEGPLPGLT
jgi:hypothetical protein